MKFGKLDTVSIRSGKFVGRTGCIVGFSQIHLNHVPQPPEYSVAVTDANVTDTFKEENLVLVKQYDQVQAEQERLAKLAAHAAEAERLADEKMEAALRKKIEREMDLREQIEKERAARKNTP